MNCLNCHHPERLHERYGCTAKGTHGMLCRCSQTFTWSIGMKFITAIGVAFMVLTLFAAISDISAQQLTPEQIANQRLAKAMDVIDTQDRYIAALEARGKAQDERDKAKDDLILIITKQRDGALAIKCNKTSYLFGIVKKTRCY